MNICEEKDSLNSVLLNPEKMRGTHVLLIGAGGLGCPIALHLAAAGVQKLTICDFDKISLHNFNRQFLYTPADVGRDKATVCAERLARFAPDCEITALSCKINAENTESIIKDFDLVILATDNTAARLCVNSVCVKRRIMLLNSGIAGAVGSIYLYIPEKTPCLACFMKKGEESADKRTISAAAGIIGGFASMTALQAISGEYNESAGMLTIIDTAGGAIDRLPIHKKAKCKICGGDLNVR